MQLPMPISASFTVLITDIEKGLIKIPQFQRNFVWDPSMSANLMDSIVKGYPIGTFIFWKTKERLKSIRNIGGQNFPEADSGDFLNFVLDGQQRLTSLYASLKGVSIKRENGLTDDFSKMYIDLNAKEDEQIVILDIQDKKTEACIKLKDLLYGGLTLLASYPDEYHPKLEEYKKRIENYQFSVITMNDATLDVATDVFSRINVGGKSLTLFEIMVARTYDDERNFDLSQKFEELIERLRPLNYETISEATVLQCISMFIKKDCSRKEILRLNKSDFIDVWNDGINAIESAVEFFKTKFGIPVSQLLPYNALVVPFAYYFYKNNKKKKQDNPNEVQYKLLRDYFWRCALSGRFSSSVETKLGQDIKRIEAILNNKQPNYDWTVDISEEAIRKNGAFSAGRSFVKAILCLYAYQQPRSFNDGSPVNISNYWLKQANSKNYHHFFPKAHLKKNTQFDDLSINNILNITIVDDFLNKRLIGSNAPSEYMKRFIKQNNDIVETMKTHLIYDIKKFGILDDDYEKFLACRARAVRKELEKRIIPQNSDSSAPISQPVSEDTL